MLSKETETLSASLESLNPVIHVNSVRTSTILELYEVNTLVYSENFGIGVVPRLCSLHVLVYWQTCCGSSVGFCLGLRDILDESQMVDTLIELSLYFAPNGHTLNNFYK